MNDESRPVSERELVEQARAALRQHLVEKASAARLRYGLYIDGEVIMRMLRDPEVVRYPVAVRFDAGPLRPGEFACVEAAGAEPTDGCTIVVHPWYEPQTELWPLLLAYYIPDINYGAVVGPAEAELYGATLLGLEVDAYYQALCELADALPRREACGDGGECSCGGIAAVPRDGA